MQIFCEKLTRTIQVLMQIEPPRFRNYIKINSMVVLLVVVFILNF